MLDPLIEPQELIAELTLFCRAFPLARPRLNKHTGVYQPLSNQAEMRKLMLPYAEDEEPIKRPCWITANMFYARSDYNNPDYVTSFDLDNVVKAICDNLVHCKILDDDKWMVGLSATKQFSAEDYNIIRIYGVKDFGYYTETVSG